MNRTYPEKVTLPLTVYLYLENHSGFRWCHDDRLCAVTARMKGHQVERTNMEDNGPFTWHNYVSKCCGCEQWINFNKKGEPG